MGSGASHVNQDVQVPTPVRHRLRFMMKFSSANGSAKSLRRTEQDSSSRRKLNIKSSSLDERDTSRSHSDTSGGLQTSLDTMDRTRPTPRKTLTLADFRTIKRQKTVEEEDNSSIDIPYNIDKPIESESLCFVCSVYTGSETYPCRICHRVYHESCLRTIGHCQDGPSTAQLLKAHTDTGWSCPKCDSLNNLLTEEEMTDLMQDFERLDINGDACISIDELLHFHERQCLIIKGRILNEEEIEMVKDEFRIMDCDNTNSIDYWEFLNYESVKLLEKRSKNSLVRLLTEREIDRARKTFQYFDLDGNGVITTAEATKAYYKWYEKFLTNSWDESDFVVNRAKTRDLDDQVVQSVKRLMTMNNTEEDTGTIAWPDYIREQALYILAARPNNTNMHLKTTEHARKSEKSEGAGSDVTEKRRKYQQR